MRNHLVLVFLLRRTCAFSPAFMPLPAAKRGIGGGSMVEGRLRASAMAVLSSEPWMAIGSISLPKDSFNITLKNGAVETVQLGSEDDVSAEAARVKALHPKSPRDSAKALERQLLKLWKGAKLALPVTYKGPTPADGGELEDLRGSWRLGASGALILEVARSLAAPGAGLGLFVRKADPHGAPVFITAGEAMCGYPARVAASALAGGSVDKTILFSMGSLSSDVWFRGERLPLGQLLDGLSAELGVDVGLAGHDVQRDPVIKRAGI